MNEVFAQNLIQTDVNQAAHLVRSMLTEKYVSPIQKAMDSESKRIKKNPCKNTRLLEALKPFVDTSVQQSLSSTIDILHTIQTLQNMNKHLPQSSQNLPIKQSSISVQNSIHADGVYDIDPSCGHQSETPQNASHSPSIVPLLMLLLLQNRGGF